MAAPRRVFYSFHYADILRVSQIRNFGVVKKSSSWEHPIDKAQWESIRRRGDARIKKWIDEQMSGCSVTVVLIGAETSERPYCQYEIKQSLHLGKGLLGIFMNNMKCPSGEKHRKGKNPLAHHRFTVIESGWWEDTLVTKRANQVFHTKDWALDDGYAHFGEWVEEAARIAGRHRR